MDARGPNPFRRSRFAAVLPVIALAMLSVIALPAVLATTSTPAFAQTAARTVQGKVVGKDGAALKGAIVYLKDSHTLAVKSAVTIDDGTYRFGQLAQNTDYEIWAALDGQKSGSKNISSFDSRKEFEITLKLDK